VGPLASQGGTALLCPLCLLRSGSPPPKEVLSLPLFPGVKLTHSLHLAACLDQYLDLSRAPTFMPTARAPSPPLSNCTSGLLSLNPAPVLGGDFNFAENRSLDRHDS
jgi:hypothetical protein